MLTVDTPRRRVSQASIKFTSCMAGCGAAVTYRTNPRVCCERCRSERRLASARKSMEKQRRQRGVTKVKGTVRACADCRCEIVLNRNLRAEVCKDCRVERDRERARITSRRKAATPEGREYQRQWERKRRTSDPAWKVSSHMRTLIHRALNGGKAGRSWREFVPYSLEELMAHLERQFMPGMTWANKGKWHIDHVVPLSSFNFEKPEDKEFQAAWALTNLRPLWGLDNIRKNARRTHLL